MEVQEIALALRQRGYKVTPQRLAVYEALRSSMAHPSAEELYGILQSDFPTMSLATVYKALEVLCEAGLARQLHVGEEFSRYDSDISSHCHVHCQVCGHMEDVPLPSVEEWMEEASKRSGYDIESQQICFHGVCPICREKINAL